MPGKPFSVEKMLEEIDHSLLKESSPHIIGEAREMFKEELAKCRVNKALFGRIKKALQITTVGGFIYSFYGRMEGTTRRASLQDPVKRQLALKRYLEKIEAFRPIFAKLASKAKKQGLTARLGIHPLYLSTSSHFPTLVFSDVKGDLFWASLEPTGKSLTVKHIQGLKCRNAAGDTSPQKLARLSKALGAMGYGRLRDGLLQDLCKASRGRFEKVHYLNPSKDVTFQIKPNLFYALARRQGMKRTPTRATKIIPKRRKP